MSKERGPDATFCPSEVARSLFSEKEWRSKMELIRAVADDLVINNKLIVLQKGAIVKALPSKAVGPIRLKIKKK